MSAPAPSPPPKPLPVLPPGLRLAGLALAAALLLGTGLTAGGLVDDAYIFARYAGNLLAGQGLVFNPGERVEGFTSPAQVLAVAAAGAVTGADLPAAAAGVSLAAALALLAVLWAGAAGTALPPREGAPAGRGGVAGIAAALLAAGAAPLALWAASGMDTALFALAVAAAAVAFEAPGRPAREGAPAVPGAGAWLLAGLAAAVRPEGAVAIVAAGILVVLRPAWRRSGRAWAGLLAALVPGAAWLAFRLAYYGEWLPNTFHAKVGAGGPALWLRGASYLVDGAVALLPLVLAAAWALPRTLRQRPFAALVAAGLLAAVALEGGDHFPAWRFWVPVVPLLALAAGEALAAAARPGRALAAAAALAAVLAAWSAWMPGPLGGDRARAGFRANVDLTATWDFAGRELGRALGPDREVALLAVGAIPYRTGWRTLDLLGLTDPHIARVRRELGHGTAGHEKYDTAYVLGRRPELVLLLLQPLPRPLPGDEVLAHVPFEAARELAADPRFREGWRLEWVPIRGGVMPVHVRRD